jgi:hypothetical protein
MEITMPKIKRCDVEMCGHNKDGLCYALAINVGGSGPICAAFAKTSTKCEGRKTIGGVGACKTTDCRFNDCLMCSAPEIGVGWHESNATCGTFSKR